MTDTQTLLDKDVQIEELARRVAVLEEALRPFAKAYDLHLTEHGCAAEVGGWVPMDDDYPLDGVHLVHFARARSALTSPSVGGGLAEENKRLRKALRQARPYIKDMAESMPETPVGATLKGIAIRDLSVIDAALGKDRT